MGGRKYLRSLPPRNSAPASFRSVSLSPDLQLSTLSAAFAANAPPRPNCPPSSIEPISTRVSHHPHHPHHSSSQDSSSPTARASVTLWHLKKQSLRPCRIALAGFARTCHTGLLNHHHPPTSTSNLDTNITTARKDLLAGSSLRLNTVRQLQPHSPSPLRRAHQLRHFD